MKERKYVVARAEHHEAYVLVSAKNQKEAIQKVENKEGKDMSTQTTFVKELPKNRWRVERLEEEEFGARGGVPHNPNTDTPEHKQSIFQAIKKLITG